MLNDQQLYNHLAKYWQTHRPTAWEEMQTNERRQAFIQKLVEQVNKEIPINQQMAMTASEAQAYSLMEIKQAFPEE